MRYRLQAARYGLQVRLMRPYSDVLGILGIVVPVTFFAVTIPFERLRIYGAILGFLIVVFCWPAIRYLGSLSAIMRSAASTEDGTRRLFEDMRRGMRVADGYPRLREIYLPAIDSANARLADWSVPARMEFVNIPTSAAGRAATEYAAVILRTVGLADLDSVLSAVRPDQPDTRRSARRTANRQRLIRKWREINNQGGMGDEEGDNYCLAEIRVGGDDRHQSLRLDVGVTSYGLIARTCEALVNEFALFSFLSQRSGPMRASTMLKCLPWRRITHRLAGSPADLFLKPYNRAAGMGVTLVTVTRNSSGRQHIYLGERSNRVGTYPNVLHIIPAGNCNTHGTHRLQRSHPQRTALSSYLRSIMRCEYLEEWFDDTKLEILRIPDWQRKVDQLWAERVREIAPIQLTGIAFDLLNLRPEICGMVEVEFTGDETLNWEYTEGVPPEQWQLSQVGNIGTQEIVQAAAASLLLAQKATRPLPRRAKGTR